MLRRSALFRQQPSWKAPGTPDKKGNVDEGEMLHPKPKGRNQQRAGLRFAKKLSFGFSMFLVCFFVVPSYVTPFYVRYIAGQDWVSKTEAKIKSIWTRRNERDHFHYMTQRKNTVWELMGFKTYDISGDENKGDITVYRK